MAAFFQSQIVIQSIGFVALILCILSYQSNRYRTLMGMRAASEFVFGIHFLLLGVTSGAALQAVGGIRNLIFIKFENVKKKMKFAIVVFCIFFTVTGILTWEGLISLIPIIAKNVSTVAFAMSNTRTIRIMEFPTYILWLVYNIACNSIAGIINASFSLVSIAIAIVRFDIPCIHVKKDNTSSNR